MAAFSNTSVDSLAKKDDTEEEALVLLPPSAFERPVGKSQASPWQDLRKANAEIEKLKTDIKTLREAKASADMLSHEVSTVTPRSASVERLVSEDGRYADVLIRRQNDEIRELKSQLAAAQSALLDRSADLDQQLSSRQREHRQIVASLEASLQDAHESHDRQLSRLMEEHRREVEELTLKVTELTSELAEVKAEHQHEISDLRRENLSLAESSRCRIQSLEQELRERDAELQQLERRVSQLKTYIGEAEQEHRPAEVWKTQTRTLENRVKLLSAEKENLESSMALLNVRLEALSEMMALQENELAKTKGNKSEKKQGSLLLTRWREKVFALLVQQKSADIVLKKENQNWNIKLQAVEEKVQSANSRVELLSHALAEKDAQMKMEQLNVARLEEELSQTQSVAECLDDQHSADLQHTQVLQRAVSQLQSRLETSVVQLHGALGQLDNYGQRIGFACGRVRLLQGQFARREALLRLELTESEKPQRDQDSKSAEHLAQELERVRRERDALAAQIKSDAETFQDRLTATRSLSEDEIEELRRKIGELESLVLDKSKTCERLSVRVEELQADVEETRERATSLSTELARQQLHLTQALEQQRTEMESQFREQLAELDRQVNDARREQTKAVVSLRQAERREARERERAAEHLGTVEAHYQRQVDRLQAALRAIEQERNLMMATLRQEGLMSKVRLERGEPIKLDFDVLDELPPLPAAAAIDKESVNAVIEDLKSLTAAVLQEDNSSEPDE